MKFLPINFHVLYIAFTLLFNFFGPRVYKDYDKTYVFVFMLIYLIVVSIGFRKGFNSSIKVYKKPTIKSNSIIRLLKISIVLAVLLFIVNIFYLKLSGRLNFSTSVGQNYRDFYDFYNDKKSGSLFTFEILFLIISAIPKYITLALGFFYFSKLDKIYKSLFILFLLLIVVTQTISLGNQKSIGDIVIFFAIALLIYAMKMSKRKQFKVLVGTGSIMAFLFVFLSYSQYSRLESRGITAFDINEHAAKYSTFDLDNKLFDVLGYKAGLGVTVFVSGYLSNGYYGLSKCLELPFQWTYGVGNSVAVSNVVEKSTGLEIYEKSYLYRMEEEFGIPGKKNWHTIFPWLASDITFYLIPFLFYFIAYYYGKSWKEVILFKNPVSLLLFSLLTVMFVFVPANNQILHGFDYFIITITVVFLWNRRHIDYNIKLIE